ncbi:MAG TPA: TspO/MBR family protein [Candidatus Paceibacterota bacterium]
MQTYKQYGAYKKPKWSPPAWLFAPVWTTLYILIAISFGYVGYLYALQAIPFAILLPFILNLIFNFAYTTIQFRWRNFMLATLDIFLVLGTLIWALWVVYPTAPWVALINIPYLLWVSFATILQITITGLNSKR